MLFFFPFIFDLAVNDDCIFPSLRSYKIMNILVYKKISQTSISIRKKYHSRRGFYSILFFHFYSWKMMGSYSIPLMMVIPDLLISSS